jgi:hypothetical protein
MDTVTKEEAGRELAMSDVNTVSGGHVSPDGDGAPDSPAGAETPIVDYAAVAGGDCLTPTEPPPQENPIWKALQDAWNGIVA